MLGPPTYLQGTHVQKFLLLFAVPLPLNVQCVEAEAAGANKGGMALVGRVGEELTGF